MVRLPLFLIPEALQESTTAVDLVYSHVIGLLYFG